MEIFRKAIENNDIDLLVSTRAAKNVNDIQQDNLTIGDKIADKVASFVGSWLFIVLVIALLISWITINVGFLFFIPFDPFPFVLLNLVLACFSAIQAPIIMMSQNRQSKKDSLLAEQDYNLNLKSELVEEEMIKRLNRIEENQKVFLGNQIKIINKLDSLTQSNINIEDQ